MITGASGLVGKAIFEELENFESEYDIICLGRQFKETSAKKNFREKFFSVDITNTEDISEIESIGKVDFLVHSAGLAHQFKEKIPENFRKVNVEGTKNIAELAVKLSAKRFVLISSVSVYGANDTNKKGNIDENFPCNPQGAYAESKYEAEKAAEIICQKNKIPLTILRLATVIGEEDKGNVVRLIDAIYRQRFVWIGRGENFKSLIYKGDVAKACRRVLASLPPEKGIEIFNVTGKPVKMREIVETISNNLGKSVPQIKTSEKFTLAILKKSKKLVFVNKIKTLMETLEKWLSDEIFSGEKIKNTLGFEPELAIKEALKREINWYLKNK